MQQEKKKNKKKMKNRRKMNSHSKFHVPSSSSAIIEEGEVKAEANVADTTESLLILPIEKLSSEATTEVKHEKLKEENDQPDAPPSITLSTIIFGAPARGPAEHKALRKQMKQKFKKDNKDSTASTTPRCTRRGNVKRLDKSSSLDILFNIFVKDSLPIYYCPKLKTLLKDESNDYPKINLGLTKKKDLYKHYANMTFMVIRTAQCYVNPEIRYSAVDLIMRYVSKIISKKDEEINPMISIFHCINIAARYLKRKKIFTSIYVMRKAGRDLKVTLTRRDIIQMEKNILETINYHVLKPTPYIFFKAIIRLTTLKTIMDTYYFKASEIRLMDLVYTEIKTINSKYFEITLQEHDESDLYLIDENALMIAASCIYSISTIYYKDGNNSTVDYKLLNELNNLTDINVYNIFSFSDALMSVYHDMKYQ